MLNYNNKIEFVFKAFLLAKIQRSVFLPVLTSVLMNKVDSKG